MVSSGYRYSYSGSDVRAYVYFEGRGDKIALLESLHTISWSNHEAKGDARALGFKGVKGFTHGPRTIAGSLITTVIEDNPLAALMDLLAEIYLDPLVRWDGWSIDWQTIGVGSGLDTTTFNRRLATTIPGFNILLQYVAEGAKWTRDASDPTITTIPGAATLIRGVEFVDEGSTTSTHDPATEMVYSWKAVDLKPISAQQFQQIINGFMPTDPSTAMAEALRQRLTIDQRTREQTYKTQVGPTFGGTSMSNPTSGVV